MKNTRLFFSIILLSSIPMAYANLVEVVKYRGSATFLSVGMLEAKPITLNQWLPKDTSILTSDKSFLVLKYKNGTTVTLGPNSKLVVDQGLKKEQQLISLLMGKLKASVKNEKQTEDNKMIVKTNGAALGIRGTEFQTTYNPETKITSLLTFHGAVAMTKLDTSKNESAASLNKIEEKLKAESVMVKIGEYSGISEKTTEVTAPVKIAPEQFTKLKLNQTMGAEAEKISETDFNKELKITESEYEKTKNAKSEITIANAYIPKAGGYIETETGIYLPPPNSAEHDNNLNIFKVTEKMGTVADSGNYIPPQGLSLDPVKGFVVEEKEKSIEKNNLAKELNEAVVKQVPPAKVEPIIKKKSKLENKDEDVYKKYFDPEKL